MPIDDAKATARLQDLQLPQGNLVEPSHRPNEGTTLTFHISKQFKLDLEGSLQRTMNRMSGSSFAERARICAPHTHCRQTRSKNTVLMGQTITAEGRCYVKTNRQSANCSTISKISSEPLWTQSCRVAGW